jgi:MATE family multidrug resistance protein
MRNSEDNINYELVKRILRLAMPMMGTQLITVAGSFLCMMMIATLGHDVLAASALIFSIRITVMITVSSILFSLSFLIGRAYGEGSYKIIGNLVQQGWTLALILSVPIILIFQHMEVVLIHLKQSPHISGIVQLFFHANVWNVLPFFLSVCNQQLCYGTNKQRVDLVANIFGLMILIFFSYILIFGKLGFPPLGVAGLGFAMSAQGWCYFIITSMYLYFHKHFNRFELFQYRVHKNWSYFWLTLKIGWPISLQMGGELLSFSVVSAMVGWLGVMSLAAYQVVLQYAFLIIIPLFSIAQASGILIGQAYGAKQFHEIKILGYSSMLIALFISTLVLLIFIIFPHGLASFYINIQNPSNAKLLHVIEILFIIAGVTQLFDGLRNVIIGGLRGLLDSKFPMWANLAVIWLVGIPLCYFLAFIMHWGVIGISIGTAINTIVAAVIMAYRWHTRVILPPAV